MMHKSYTAEESQERASQMRVYAGGKLFLELVLVGCNMQCEGEDAAVVRAAVLQGVADAVELYASHDSPVEKKEALATRHSGRVQAASQGARRLVGRDVTWRDIVQQPRRPHGGRKRPAGGRPTS